VFVRQTRPYAMFQLIRESTLKVVVTIYSIKVSSCSQYFITRWR